MSGGLIAALGLLGCERASIQVLIPALAPAEGGASLGGAGAPALAGSGGSAGGANECERCSIPDQVCLREACVTADGTPKLATAVGANCLVLADGRLYCWGRNDTGELGVDDLEDRLSPTPSAIELRFDQLSGFGGESFCGIALDRSLWCWGHNKLGVLGLGDTVTRPAPAQVGASGEWGLSLMASGHACARKLDATWWCWGRNVDGELGLGSRADQLLPVPLPAPTAFAELALGWGHTCALAEDGGLWCWGRNAESQLGLGDTVTRTAAVALDIGSDWSRVSAGALHTCALRSDQTLWCWGQNDRGQLGLGDKVVRAEPTRVPGGPWVEVAAGAWSTCAIDQLRQLFCFGSLAADATSPRRVGDIADAASLSVGGRQACALRATGALWCWGSNEFGQLGQGDRAPRAGPVEVKFSGG